MRLDPDRGRLGAVTGDAEHLRVEVVPVSAMNVLFPLRAEHYARVCKPHRHLCNLIAQHVGTRIDRAALERTRATELALRE